MSAHTEGEFLVAALLGGPALLAWGFASLRKQRVVSDTPSSTVRGAAMGLVELAGHAAPLAPTVAPVSRLPACWWRCVVIQGSGKRQRTLKTVSHTAPFYVEDATGRLLVDPLDAEIHFPSVTTRLNSATRYSLDPVLRGWGIDPEGFLGFSKNIRVVEYVIPAGHSLFVLGDLAPAQNTSGYAEDRKSRFLARMRAAKQDPEMMRRADANGDGVVDPEEWDRFRVQLEEAFHKEVAVPDPTPPPPAGIVRASQDHPFIIAPSENKALGLYRWGWPAVTGGVVLSAAGVWYALHTGMSPPLTAGLTALGFAGGVALGVHRWRIKAVVSR